MHNYLRDDVIMKHNLSAFFQVAFFFEKMKIANISCNNLAFLTSLVLSKVFHCCLQSTKQTLKLVVKTEIKCQ